MIIQKPHLCSRLQIWFPKYHTDREEYEVWLSKTKVHHSSPVIIIEFTKAKHLIGQRFCITRDVAQRCEQGTNGKIPIYRAPMSKLEGWKSAQEVKDLAISLFEET